MCYRYQNDGSGCVWKCNGQPFCLNACLRRYRECSIKPSSNKLIRWFIFLPHLYASFIVQRQGYMHCKVIYRHNAKRGARGFCHVCDYRPVLATSEKGLIKIFYCKHQGIAICRKEILHLQLCTLHYYRDPPCGLRWCNYITFHW